MLRVALTGGIATGKSYVRARIAGRGVPTVDADRVVHDLLLAGTPVTRAIGTRFGPAVIAPSGDVDRRALARLVFAAPAERRGLEAIVHPAVYEVIDRWMTTLAGSAIPPSWLLADIPLLFETGRQARFDRVLVTACSRDRQLARIMERDGSARGEAEARLQAQWPVEEKARLADRVIVTDGTLEDTDRQVEDVCRWLDDLAAVRPAGTLCR